MGSGYRPTQALLEDLANRWSRRAGTSGNSGGSQRSIRVRDGPNLEVAAATATKEKKKERSTAVGPKESETEKRLSALRGRSPRVSFADPPGRPRSMDPADTGRTGYRDGALRRLGARSAEPGQQLAVWGKDKVKVETIDFTRDRDRSVPIRRRQEEAEDGRSAGSGSRVATEGQSEAREEPQ